MRFLCIQNFVCAEILCNSLFAFLRLTSDDRHSFPWYIFAIHISDIICSLRLERPWTSILVNFTACQYSGLIIYGYSSESDFTVTESGRFIGNRIILLWRKEKSMKKLFTPKMYKLCTLCLALTAIITIKHPSFIFFGEPKLPTE